jgi:formiminotetrahydrofolate cyclodeaminase
VDGIDAYLERLASADPTPGGGSAATLVGAFGAALCAMVARITRAGARYAAVHGEADAIVAAADALRARFVAARAVDEEAYARVVAASALAKSTDDEKLLRTGLIQEALAGAAEAPLAAAAMAAEGAALARRTEALGNTHLVSDVECALAFFRAALESSAANVRINHRFMRDAERVRAQDERLGAILIAARSA